MELFESVWSVCDKNKWTNLSKIMKPTDFASDITGSLPEPKILAKIAEKLTTKNLEIPDSAKIFILKCLSNSCVNGYLHKPLNQQDGTENLYTNYLSILIDISKGNKICDFEYPSKTHFPYEEITKFAVDQISYFLISEGLTDEKLNIVRLCLQFICNLLLFSCKTKNFPCYENPPNCLEDENFKKSLLKLINHENSSIARATIVLIHTAITQSSENFFTDSSKQQIFKQMISLMIKTEEIPAAIDTVIFLIKEPNFLEKIYDGLEIEEKIALLDVVLQEVRENGYGDKISDFFPQDAVQFLSEKFKRKSDLILKTVDSYLNGLEPSEVTTILDILGVLTSNSLENYAFLKNDTSLLINCIFLLKSLHMAGKETNNCFTPIQKLSELVVDEQKKTRDEEGKVVDIQKHPAFGFKVGLIRVIGNMVEKHTKNQDTVRETDGIPLLMDCCNIDARNPLIIQWVTLAMKNLTENNHENQKVIHDCTKIGVVDSSVIREMGFTLNEGPDKSIGIIPLDSLKKK